MGLSSVSDAHWLRLSGLIADTMGLYFPRERWKDLQRGLAGAADEFGFDDVEACIAWLLSQAPAKAQLQVLANHLTIGETYFFRDKQTLEALAANVLPELLRTRPGREQRLRIWSAGCCTGEEPYSIAMLLDRLVPQSKEWNVTILATDINPVFLRKAAEGIFGEWSFRETPDWARERYFNRTKGGRFEILPHIRSRVTFSYLNLADDVYPSLTNNTSAMDVIFCRNVLMYFSPAWAGKVARNFYRSLVDDGWLIVSPTETSSSLFSQFKAMTFPGATFYHKSGGAESQTGAAASSAPPFDPLLDTLRMPAPALAADVYTLQKEGKSSSPLNGIQPEISAETNEPVQSVDSVAANPLNRDARDTLCRTARFHANQGRLAEAVTWCEKAIAADKLNPATYYLLATIRQEQGEGEAAAQSLTRALYIDPDFVLAHFALGNLYLAQWRHREARRHFDNAQALLHRYPQDEILPESEGLTAGRLGEIIESVRLSLPHAAATDS